MADSRAPAELWRSGSFKVARGREPQPLFGQVHEDSAVEALALSATRAQRHAVVIGSGGCTALALLAQSPERLTILDINPAQLWLIELKRAAFLRLGYEQMRACFDADARPCYPELRPRLSDEARRFWDSHQALLTHGLSHAGLAERNMRRAMCAFRVVVHGRAAIRQMLSHTDLTRQRAEFYRSWDTWRWRMLFRFALHRAALRLAYAPEFLAALPPDFAARMNAQVDEVFLRFPAATNPYLWQTFLGEYPPGGDAALPIHLRRAHFETIRDGLSRAALVCADLAVWLADEPARSIDFFALSNILEVTGRDYPERLFAQIARSAAPGALVCLRSIFPDRSEPRGDRWREDPELTDAARAIDRTLGCRNVRIFRVR